MHYVSACIVKNSSRMFLAVKIVMLNVASLALSFRVIVFSAAYLKNYGDSNLRELIKMANFAAIF